MKSKICTSIEQSQKLIELGVDVNTADMYWWYSGKRYYIESMDDDDFNKESDIPAWSLAALRACLPPGISIDGILYVFESHNTFDNEWVYEYKFEDISAPLYSKASNEIDACVAMIEKLHELNLL